MSLAEGILALLKDNWALANTVKFEETYDYKKINLASADWVIGYDANENFNVVALSGKLVREDRYITLEVWTRSEETLFQMRDEVLRILRENINYGEYVLTVERATNMSVGMKHQFRYQFVVRLFRFVEVE